MKKYYIILFLAIGFGLAFLLKLNIINAFYYYKFDEEIIKIKDSLSLIANGNQSDLLLATTEDANVLRIEIVNKLSAILKNVNINTLKVSKIETKNEKETTSLFADIYFENDIDKGMHVKLEKQKKIWKLASISVSEKLLMRVTH